MKKISLFISLLCLCSIAFGQGKTLSLQTDKSTFTWTGKAAFDAFSLSGSIAAKKGALQNKKKNITTATVVIDMRSIASETKGLVKHLKNSDFFEVKKYPTALFELDSILTISTEEEIAKGWLTIKEKRIAFECPVQIQQLDKQLLIRGTAIVDRVKYGIVYNSPTAFPAIQKHAIADNFELAFNLVFEK